MSGHSYDKAAGRRQLSRRQLLSQMALLGSAVGILGCDLLPTVLPQATSPAPSPTTAPPTALPTTTTTVREPTAIANNIPAKVPDQPTAAPTATRTPGAAKLTEKLNIIQARALSPAHDDFVRLRIQEFSVSRSYPLNLVDADAFAGSVDIVQKLTAAVSANSAPDALVHSLNPMRLRATDSLADLTDLTRTLIQRYGEVTPATKRISFLEGRWWSAPYYLQARGTFVRGTAFQGKNIDLGKGLRTIDQVREACLAVSNPTQQFWGWGMTGNRCEKGETLVSDVILMCGGQLTEETGQRVMLNRSEFRDGAAAGLSWLRDAYADPQWSNMLPPGVRSWTNESNVVAYLDGRVALTSDTGALFSRAVSEKRPIADDTYLITPPMGLEPNPRSKAGADDAFWFVLKGAKNRDAAEQLIEYVLSPENQQEIFRRSPGNAYPSYLRIWDDPAIRDSREAQHVTGAFRAAAWDETGFTGPDWPGPPSLWVQALTQSGFWTDILREVLEGKGVDDALADAHARAVKVAQDFGARGT